MRRGVGRWEWEDGSGKMGVRKVDWEEQIGKSSWGRVEWKTGAGRWEWEEGSGKRGVGRISDKGKQVFSMNKTCFQMKIKIIHLMK